MQVAVFDRLMLVASGSFIETMSTVMNRYSPEEAERLRVMEIDSSGNILRILGTWTSVLVHKV